MTKKIEDVMLERIIELAEQSGYKPIVPTPGTFEGHLKNSQMEVMFTRFAYAIAKELQS